MAKQKTLVVGAGPVGALAALYAAGRGDEVEVYELRGDLRDPSTTPLNFTKSINLALSERGINSLRRAKCPGLVEAVLDETIPMHGRMIHGRKNGENYEESQSYDVQGRFISAVDRASLNKRLLDELEKMPNVKLYFNHKLVGADYKKCVAWFEKKQSTRTDHPQNPTQEIEVKFDFMIGADGAHSAVRYHLMKYTRMDYMQEYIDTLWCEFHIDRDAAASSKHDGFKISPNHLHIWPGGSFMFIAIPSLDKSFTSTLFLPASRFAELDENPNTLVQFFQENFPGVVPDLISESDLQKQYSENPHLPLISIKCAPYHFGSSAVILGDAAHAMVPFYGQGMNAGLEDVRTLYDILDTHCSTSESFPSLSPESRARQRTLALDEYSKTRQPDAHAINDLALRNYQEMRSDVQSPLYRLRKFIEEQLHVRFPGLGFATQYSRVSFGNDRYSEVESRAKMQGQVLLGGMGVSLLTGLCWAGWWVWRWRKASATTKAATVGFGWIGARLEEFGRRFI
ncbi:FAD/NAD(P)-binding domain-containing protein [Saccharata proteae CBS 121410]|uniref:Kynurenine 3-monooxygenase n=1 Tax=Saccharata proteae CBS 121410 TaxID=1314787 RepID=A0A6A5YBE7_9PEZI|nr:FAD/NAD(P)-binding domain-containing protein [Saccharata proteae CBS 121410]